MRYIQYCFIGSLLFLSGCEKFNSKKHYVLESGFRSFFSYNNGSEWLYHEINDTSDTQKVAVSGFLSGKMSWDAFDQEFLQYDLISNTDSSYKIRAIADENNVARAVLLVKDTFYKQSAEWYYLNGQFAGTSGSGDSFSFYPNYVQAGTNYTDVIVLKPKKSAFFKRIFIARKVGIIRKELTSGKIYILKSYLVQ